jgi:uncharacterized membrane protein
MKKLLEKLDFQKRKLKKLPNDRNILGLDDLMSPEEYAVIDRENSRILSPEQITKRLQVKGTKNWLFKISDWAETKFTKYRSYVTLFIVVFITIWIIMNLPGIEMWFTNHGYISTSTKVFEFDPFPYTRLSIVLSFLGALFSNLVFVAQKAAEERERKKSDIDLELNQGQYAQIEAILDELKNIREDLTTISQTQVNMIGAISLLATNTNDIVTENAGRIVKNTGKIDQILTIAHGLDTDNSTDTTD